MSATSLLLSPPGLTDGDHDSIHSGSYFGGMLDEALYIHAGDYRTVVPDNTMNVVTAKTYNLLRCVQATSLGREITETLVPPCATSILSLWMRACFLYNKVVLLLVGLYFAFCLLYREGHIDDVTMDYFEFSLGVVGSLVTSLNLMVFLLIYMPLYAAWDAFFAVSSESCGCDDIGSTRSEGGKGVGHCEIVHVNIASASSLSALPLPPDRDVSSFTFFSLCVKSSDKLAILVYNKLWYKQYVDFGLVALYHILTLFFFTSIPYILQWMKSHIVSDNSLYLLVLQYEDESVIAAPLLSLLLVGMLKAIAIMDSHVFCSLLSATLSSVVDSWVGRVRNKLVQRHRRSLRAGNVVVE